jgi:hypothetical protein
MNEDNMPTDQVETNQWQEMLQDRRALPAWEIVVTVLTLMTVRQHRGLAVTTAAHRPGRDSSDAARGQDPLHQLGLATRASERPRPPGWAAALITLAGAVVAVASVL